MGKAVTIEVVGVDAVQKRFANIAQMKSVKKAVKQATAIVESYAKSYCPVDTGNLRNSIHMRMIDEDTTGKVYTSCEYAPYVEFGTGMRGSGSNYPKAADLGLAYSPTWAGQVAQPFMYPALKTNEPRIKAMIRDAVKEETK